MNKSRRLDRASLFLGRNLPGSRRRPVGAEEIARHAVAPGKRAASARRRRSARGVRAADRAPPRRRSRRSGACRRRRRDRSVFSRRSPRSRCGSPSKSMIITSSCATSTWPRWKSPWMRVFTPEAACARAASIRASSASLRGKKGCGFGANLVGQRRQRMFERSKRVRNLRLRPIDPVRHVFRRQRLGGEGRIVGRRGESGMELAGALASPNGRPGRAMSARGPALGRGRWRPSRPRSPRPPAGAWRSWFATPAPRR